MERKKKAIVVIVIVIVIAVIAAAMLYIFRDSLFQKEDNNVVSSFNSDIVIKRMDTGESLNMSYKYAKSILDKRRTFIEEIANINISSVRYKMEENNIKWYTNEGFLVKDDTDKDREIIDAIKYCKGISALSGILSDREDCKIMLYEGYSEELLLKGYENCAIIPSSMSKYINKEIPDNEKVLFISDTFGTGGLRGILGAGTNRMNIYTVRKATFGLASVLSIGSSVAIAYDSRIKSDLFAKEAATVLANCKMKVYLFDRVSPTPLLSFAVRQLKCDSGIVITASHNPSNYNGYKVYNSKGCQINPETADLILRHINKTDIFYELPGETDFDTCIDKGLITYIEDSLIEDFIDTVCKQAFYDGSKRIKIVYTPLNGSGYECVSGAMAKRGFKNFITVREQMHPDGRFPTCPYPNPEVREALQLGIRDLINSKSDILIATDPDCDRAGLAVRKDNQAVILNGNEVGILLLDYICMMRKKKNIMPKCPVAIKTIVTTELATKIAEHYGVTVIDTLTGFKFIGDQIAILEEKGREDSFIFGFEESCGYLSGTYVRDKDAVNAAVLIADMADYYKDKDISLLDRLEELYKKFGYLISYLGNYEYPGTAGLSKMRSIMENLRKSTLLTKDYLNETDMLHADVLKFDIKDFGTAIVRPSGTEPKIKIYYFAEGCDMIDAKEKMKKPTVLIERMLN